MLAIQAEVIGIQRYGPGKWTRRVHTPKADLVVGDIVEESRFVHVGPHCESVDVPRVDFGHHLEAIKAEPNIWPFTDVHQSSGAIFQLLPARPNFDPVTCSGGTQFQKRRLKIEFLFVYRTWTALTEGVQPALKLKEGASAFAEVKVQREHVPLIEVSVHEGLLSPIIVSDLLPDLTDFPADRHVPIIRVFAESNVFDLVPGIPSETHVAQKAPILVFPQ